MTIIINAKQVFNSPTIVFTEWRKSLFYEHSFGW